MQPSTRTETDALGSLDLPAEALYGIQTQRAVLNLSFSGRPLGVYPQYVAALAAVKQAAARANLTAKVIEERPAQAIEQACDELRGGAHMDHFPVDVLGGGGSIGVNMNVNEVIANLANERLGGQRGKYSPVDPKLHVNASQSTADVCHTALRIALLQEWVAFKATLDAVVRRLEHKRQDFAEIPTLARTCLQDALPSTLGVLLGGYAALLGRRAAELQVSTERLCVVSLGGTVIGTGDGATPRYRKRVVPMLCEVTGMDLRSAADPSDALQNSDDIAQISAQLALLAQALIKVAQDLRLLASGPRGGFGEIVLPHVQAGSSFFGNKSNPVVPETVLQCAFQVLGCDRAVQAAVEHGELYLNVFDGLAVVNVLDAVVMLTEVLGKFDANCLHGLRANEKRCRELAALATPPKGS